MNTNLIELARIAAGLSQGTLAKRLGKSQPFISQVERGERDIPSDLIQEWAHHCEVPVSYFSRNENLLDEPIANLIHRKMTTLPARSFQTANAKIKLISLEVDSLFSEVKIIPSVELPNLPSDIGPGDAAAAVRREWEIPSGPLPNLVKLVESAGIPTVFLETLHDKHSALSIKGKWFDWLIVLNSNHPASRLRFSLAHELGHIILKHNYMNGMESNVIEAEANAFAGNLLFPESYVRRELNKLTFSHLIYLKQRWKVSIAFLIRQAFDYGLIDSYSKQKLYIELAKQPGGRRREVAEFDSEEPTLIRRIIESLQDEGLSITEIADLATINESILRQRYLREPQLKVVSEVKEKRVTIQL